MRLQSKNIQGVPCMLAVPHIKEPWPVAILCGGEMRERLAEIAQDMPPMLLFSAPASWESDYTPWPSPALPGRAAFTGQAQQHLDFLLQALRMLEAEFPVSTLTHQRAMAGYSLGGLFTLWAMQQASQAAGIGHFGSISGSLWYEGFIGYLRTHLPARGTRATISLGKSEARAGPGRMGCVGERTRETVQILKRALGADQVDFIFNRGGHFTGITSRWRKALDAFVQAAFPAAPEP